MSPCEPQQVRTIRAISTRGQRATRRVERELQRLPGQAGDERADEPAETDRNSPGERHRLALQVGPAVALEKTPVRVQTPEIAAVVADRLLALGGSTSVIHF